MMKKAKRFFAVMLASALTLSLFSGCSNNQPGGEQHAFHEHPLYQLSWFFPQ